MGTSFEYSKTLCGEGSILLILGVVPYVGWVLGIIGVILLLRGLKELANYYQDNEIYQNSLTGVKYYIIALIAAAVAITAIVIGVGTATGFKFSSHFTLTAGFGIGLVSFLRRAYHCFHILRTCSFALKKNLQYACAEIRRTLVCHRRHLALVGFHTDNNGWFGLILIFIAWIFAVIGFFSMKSQQQQQMLHNNTVTLRLPTQIYSTAISNSTILFHTAAHQ